MTHPQLGPFTAQREGHKIALQAVVLQATSVKVFVCVCVLACVRMYMRACLHTCMCACVRAYMHADYACVSTVPCMVVKLHLTTYT